jgi:lysophospholipase L1-like esterase
MSTRINLLQAVTLLLVGGLALLTTAPSRAQQVGDSSSATPAPLPVKITPTNPLIRYVGRFDRRDPAGPRCSWSASTVALRFTGSELNAVLNDSGDSDEYQLVIDGKPTAKIKLDSGTRRYNLFRDTKPGTHTLALVKCTEGFFGVTRFEGFELSQGGKLVSLPAPKRRIEIIGDSISCGFGNEAPSEKEKFSSATENAFYAYGPIAARARNADLHCVAWSGRLMWPNNTMDEVYGRALASDASSVWDFAQWKPDVVIVALGTNDFAGGTPDRKRWIAGYRAFLARVRKNYPRAAIYCATSPMTWGEPDKILRSYLDEIVREENTAGHKNVRLLPFATQDGGKHGFGAQWHPSQKTHQVMADTMIAVLGVRD